jgi:ABC-2 type transport system permease protein
MQQIEEVYDSARRPHPVVEEFLALINNWDLVILFISRSIKTRYKRSFLGVVWSMLNPILTTIVLSLVFTQLFKFQIPNYPIYILTGLTAWVFFSSTTNQAMREIVFSGGLLSRIYVPKAAFVVSAIGTGLINLGFSLITVLIIALVLRAPFTWSLLVLPFAILLLSMFSLGVGLILAAAAVYFADIIPIYEVFITIWMYATPIIYPLSIIPKEWLGLFLLNPLYYLIELFRLPMYQGTIPGWETWLVATLYSCVTLVVGWYIFTVKSHEYAYRV